MYGSSVAVLKKADYISPIISKIAKERKYKTYDFKFTDSLSSGDSQEYKGEVRRATLNGLKANQERESLKLIIKSVPSGKLTSEVFCKYEVFAYEEIHRILDQFQTESDIPEKCKLKFVERYGTSTEPKKQALILKDLSFDGYQVYNGTMSLDYDHLMVTLNAMATLHALGFAIIYKSSNKKLLEIRENTLSKKDHGSRFYVDLQQFGKCAVGIIESEEDKATLRRYYNCTVDEMTRRFDAFLNFDSDNIAPYTTISHGDFWIKNILYNYKDGKPQSMYLLDWQKVRFTSPIIDLAHLVYFCLNEEMRDKCWEEILTVYYETLKIRLKELKCNIKDCYPEAIYRTDLNKKFGYGMVMSMMLLPLRMTDTVVEWDKKTMALANIKYSNDCKTRLNEIVRHARKMNFVQ